MGIIDIFQTIYRLKNGFSFEKSIVAATTKQIPYEIPPYWEQNRTTFYF